MSSLLFIADWCQQHVRYHFHLTIHLTVRLFVVCFCWASISNFFARLKIWWIIRRMWCAWMSIVSHPYFGYYIVFCLLFYFICSRLGRLSLVELGHELLSPSIVFATFDVLFISSDLVLATILQIIKPASAQSINFIYLVGL